MLPFAAPHARSASGLPLRFHAHTSTHPGNPTTVRGGEKDGRRDVPQPTMSLPPPLLHQHHGRHRDDGGDRGDEQEGGVGTAETHGGANDTAGHLHGDFNGVQGTAQPAT